MSEIKRLKRDAQPSFKKKSNEGQFKVNKSILEAFAALDRKELQKTKEALYRGMSLLKEGQKLIVLADKSLCGWKTVLEYKHHDLADEDEDEKKIYRVETGKPEPPNASLLVVSAGQRAQFNHDVCPDA